VVSQITMGILNITTMVLIAMVETPDNKGKKKK
jgi:hypothetical protein